MVRPLTFSPLPHVLQQRLNDLGTTLPLEELFLEGPVRPDDFAHLLIAIGHLPNLKRLALYQTRNPKPALFEDLARVAPQLTALVIVAGDSQEAVEWPLPLVRLERWSGFFLLCWHELRVARLVTEYCAVESLG